MFRLSSWMLWSVSLAECYDQSRMTFIYFIDNTTSTDRVTTGLGMYVENNLKKVDGKYDRWSMDNVVGEVWVLRRR